MRGLRTDRTAQVVIAGHAFVQNLRSGRRPGTASARAGYRPAARPAGPGPPGSGRSTEGSQGSPSGHPRAAFHDRVQPFPARWRLEQ
ncbi:hypothetical protein [Micromonospora sp. CB01531]|uniref:hypothetical protein n=1 Tax=Micromonospora sp. CB01531 TaxID=1718947 RepID=UPI003FD1E4D6